MMPQAHLKGTVCLRYCKMSVDKTKPVERKDFLALAYYEVGKKLYPFTGSRGNMCYMVVKEYYVPEEASAGLDDENAADTSAEAVGDAAAEPEKLPRFKVYYWPGPYAFDKTADTLKQEAFFDFSEEALNKIAEFLNDKYESNLELWHTDTMR